MNLLLPYTFLCSYLTAHLMADEAPGPEPHPAKDKTAYEQAAAGVWQPVFSDPCAYTRTDKETRLPTITEADFVFPTCLVTR